MEESKVITIGICLEGPQQKVGNSSGLLTTMIKNENTQKILFTHMEYNFVVPECFKKKYIEIYLSYILNKHLLELKSIKGYTVKDKVSARNYKTIEYFMGQLKNDLEEFGFKLAENEDVQPKEFYYYSNAKSKNNQKYVDNFKSWYNPTLKINYIENQI